MKEINSQQYYSAKQLSQHWNVCQRTIERLVDRKEITALKIGRQFRIRGESILKYEARNLIKSKY